MTNVLAMKLDASCNFAAKAKSDGDGCGVGCASLLNRDDGSVRVNISN
jgi:hypothetical protein